MRYIWSDLTDLSMDSASIAVLIGALLTMASVLFGAKYKQGKGKKLSVFKGREAKLNRTISNPHCKRSSNNLRYT